VWAEKNRNQQKALLEKSFISQSAFDNIQSNYDVAVARLHAAEAELVVARKSQGDAVLVAPFSGIVSARHAQPGERVALDAKVVSIVDLSRLQLEASVPPAAIGQVKVGQAMTSASRASASANSPAASSASTRRPPPARARSASTR
jgi:multidrug resistance efflux pump